MFNKIRYVVGYFGFLALFSLVTLAVFGQFGAEETVQLNENTSTCVGFIYLFFCLGAALVNYDLVSDKPTTNMKSEAWGLIAYVLFMIVEYLMTGDPSRGALHTLLPFFALPFPAVIGMVSKV